MCSLAAYEYGSRTNLLSIGWPAAYYRHQGAFQLGKALPAKSASSCLGLWSANGAPQQIIRTLAKKCTKTEFTSALNWCEERPISCTRNGVSAEHCFQWLPSVLSLIAGPLCDTSVSPKKSMRPMSGSAYHPSQENAYWRGACDSALPA